MIHHRSTLRPERFQTSCTEQQWKVLCARLCENLVTFCCLFLSDHILCSVTWPTDTRIAVQWLTRKQNYVIVQIYDFDGSSWKEKQVAVTFPLRGTVTVSQVSHCTIIRLNSK